MNKILAYLLILLTAQGAIAGPVVNTISNDTLRFGKPSSGLDKTLEFNLGLGASNPRVKWSVTDSALEFANDGTSFVGVGSGSGGATGINLLGAKNGDFESGTVNWTASGGTFVIDSSTPINGKKTGSWTPSATSQTLSSFLAPLTEGTKGVACAATIRYKTSEPTNFYTLKVIDGSANLLASVQLPSPVSVVSSYALPFLCPSSGSVQVQVVSSGSAAAIKLDDVAIGKLDFSVQSQATLVGKVRYVCNQFWPDINSGTWTSFAANGGTCTVTASGNVSAPGTNIPGVVVPNQAPGNYQVIATAEFIRAGNTNGVASFRFIDSNSNTSAVWSAGDITTTGEFVGAGAGIGNFTYSTSQSTNTYQIQGVMDNNTGGAAVARIGQYSSGAGGLTTNANLEIAVYRFPTSAELAVKIETLNPYVDAYLSGTNWTMATSTTTQTKAELTDAAGIITAATGSASVQIPCSGTNPSTGSTCAAGTEDLGVVFNVPSPGVWTACVDATVSHGLGAGITFTQQFYLVETPNNAQTILQGDDSSTDLSEQPPSGGTWSRPISFCKDYNFTSAGQKTLRMVYSQTNNGTVSQNLILGDATNDRKIHIRAFPKNVQMPTPILVGGVTTPSSGQKNIVSGYFAGGSLVAVCSASPCTVYGGGNENVSSVTRSSAGVYVVNFAVGTFSGVPICTCTPEAHTVNGCQIDMAATTNMLTQINTYNSAGTLVNGNATFNCVGPK